MKEEYKKYYHPKFKIVADMIHILYNLDGCCCGGLCHIVTDDNNINNSSLECVIKMCNENKDEIDSELSKTICELLLQMSIEQRIILFYSIDEDFMFDSYEEYEYDQYFDTVYDPKYIIELCKKEDRYNIG